MVDHNPNFTHQIISSAYHLNVTAVSAVATADKPATALKLDVVGITDPSSDTDFPPGKDVASTTVTIGAVLNAVGKLTTKEAFC